MKSTMRRYQRDEDYWRIRKFLRDVLILNNRDQVSWEVVRFDYWRWHGILNCEEGTLEDGVFIWEGEDGEIVAVLNREGAGCVFLQIHPAFRTDKLEKEMLSVAEQYLATSAGVDRQTLYVWAGDDDTQLRQTLSNRGYVLCTSRKPEYQRKRKLTEPIPSVPIAAGYTIRSMGDIDEHHSREWVSWRAFHPKEPDEGFEGDWYRNVQRSPLYRRDLDIVAVAPNSEHAAFCTVWFDDMTRTGVFEPVGTAPEHQRRGLGKAVLTEGLNRLMHLGADLAYIGSYSEGAHALYASVGFEKYRILEPWIKEI